MFEAVLAAITVAAASMIGALFFGNTKKLIGAQRYVVPMAVGVFLSLVLYELLPETLAAAPSYGGAVVAIGFIAFYILAHKLHHRYHHLESADCDRKGAAALLLIGDGIHNVADGVILGGAFLIDPTVGVATAIGLALHEVPQEIVEFGVLIRAGYSRMEALKYNFLSASSIVLGVLFIMFVADYASEYIWILTGLAAGNLLYLAASDLLPRIHGNLKNYGSIWHSTLSIIVGFVSMTMILIWSHEYAEKAGGHGHDHGHGVHVEEEEKYLNHDEHTDHDGHDH